MDNQLEYIGQINLSSQDDNVVQNADFNELKFQNVPLVLLKHNNSRAYGKLRLKLLSICFSAVQGFAQDITSIYITAGNIVSPQFSDGNVKSSNIHLCDVDTVDLSNSPVVQYFDNIYFDIQYTDMLNIELFYTDFDVLESAEVFEESQLKFAVYAINE